MKVAVVRVRGRRTLSPKIEHALNILKLQRVNSCIVVSEEDVSGILHVCKDYITWGPVSKEIEEQLDKRKNEKGVIMLHPPRRGYRSIKKPYPVGALGRRESMDLLLRRMM